VLALGAALLALIVFVLLREPRDAAIAPERAQRPVPVARADAALENEAPRTELAAVAATEERTKLPVPNSATSATSASAPSELVESASVRIEVELVPEGKAEQFILSVIDAHGEHARPYVDASHLDVDGTLHGLAPGTYTFVLRDRAFEPPSMYLVPEAAPYKLTLTLTAEVTQTARFRVPVAGRAHLDFGAAPPGLVLEVQRRRLDRVHGAKPERMPLVLDDAGRRAGPEGSTYATDSYAAPGQSYLSPALTPGRWELIFKRVSDDIEIERREVVIRAGEIERVRY